MAGWRFETEAGTLSKTLQDNMLTTTTYTATLFLSVQFVATHVPWLKGKYENVTSFVLWSSILRFYNVFCSPNITFSAPQSGFSSSCFLRIYSLGSEAIVPNNSKGLFAYEVRIVFRSILNIWIAICTMKKTWDCKQSLLVCSLLLEIQWSRFVLIKSKSDNCFT